ncbi:SPOSA6832_02057, partial [Sporobolomyces salmonicolor]
MGTQGGLVLWSRSFTPSPSPFDSLIREALIEQRDQTPSDSAVSRWDKDHHSLLWLLANDLHLVFVVAYQRILSLSYVEDLLEAVRKAFLKAYGDVVKAIVDSTRGKDLLVNGASGAGYRLFGTKGWQDLFKGWDETFNRILKELEASASKTQLVSLTFPPPSYAFAAPSLATSADIVDAQTIARNIAALKARQKAAAKGKVGKKGSESEAGSESDGTPIKPKRAAKAATKWSDSRVSEADLATYDYSSDAPSASNTGSSTPLDTTSLVSSSALGKRDAKSGLYEVADYAVGNSASSDEEDEVPTPAASSSSTLGSLFSRLSLSSRALTSADLQPALQAMQSHLMAKNVAKAIAEQLVVSVGKSLEGRKVSGWGAAKKEVRNAVQEALVRILTPKTSTDLLLEITRKRSTTKGLPGGAEPYAITFVGVNGVGKSTNLSKVAFWLLQNRMRVLIAACDTFRSGAVEQLRVHVRNLGRLEEELGGGGAGKIELFEKGYGKDAAGIAKDAIAYGKQNGFDVVLIDTAGRMQDNEPLMRALAKLITVNQPDKIIFVGEALVGNEAVDQLTKFNRSLRDFSGSGAGGGKGTAKEARGIDGMILTKFDTIDDKVGAALSMTYVTGQPIYFVGTGQTYSDLRMLRVGHIVGALLQG